MDNNTYGVITEQGDLGLGFDVLNEEDQKVYSEAVTKRNEELKKAADNSNVKSVD